MNGRGLKRVFWLLGIVLFAVGLVGWYDRFANGHRNANYGSFVTWGLWVAAYVFFMGLSAGSFLISSLVYVFRVKRFEKVARLAVFTAVVTLLLGMLSISVDLGHMGRAYRVLIHPNFSSPMAWMIWAYLVYFVLLMTQFWLLIRADLARGATNGGLRAAVCGMLTLRARDTSAESAERDLRKARVLAGIGLPVALMFPAGVGALFGVVAAQPAWHSGLFPVLFILSAVASGAALLTVTATVFQGGWRRNSETVVALGRVVLVALALVVLCEASEFLVGLYGGVPGHVHALGLVLSGPYWWVFWVWQLALGAVIPILLLSLPTRNDPRMVSLAGLLVAVGFVGVRLNIVIPSLAGEELRGLSEAFVSGRLQTSYFPSSTEWLLMAGVVGLGLLLFGVGETLLPESSDDLSTAAEA
ncbi:polysulfide reductase NrfD [Candidatus Poribacteria bacterium]|jgi:protein NrfD|nr:polysulfide reductase NrfD [Candidatus Poribacteria bacterium]MBT5535021.1 polysulfide reductase NrfD [Candidatus Poribacteria bacterium]MBT7096986.1 polysulfide reductase NrfD [Candidatus Poribacteria bacterium]MBT7807361.1 polysulfide reductase NrfD [Candidatus Poribacteria bacterium]